MIVVAIEDYAGQHAPLRAIDPPFCKCGGDAYDGGHSCLYCGRYVRELYNPSLLTRGVTSLDRIVRARPHSDLEAVA